MGGLLQAARIDKARLDIARLTRRAKIPSKPACDTLPEEIRSEKSRALHSDVILGCTPPREDEN
jgi:hypothetical protein